MKDFLNRTKWTWGLLALGGCFLAHAITQGGVFYLLLIPWFTRLYLNLEKPVQKFGGKLFVAGGASNLLAMAANGWQMPVTNFPLKDLKNISDPLHTVATHSTVLLPLIDRFNYGFAIVSVGDLFVTAGVVVMILGSFIGGRERTSDLG